MLFHIAFDKDSPCHAYLTGGWSKPERDLVWSLGRESTLIFPRPGIPGTYELRMKVLPFVPPQVPYKNILVFLDGQLLGQVTVRSETEMAFFVEWDLIGRGPNFELKFVHTNAGAPREFVLDSNDPRELSIALRFVEMHLLSAQDAELPEYQNSDNLLYADEALREHVQTSRQQDIRLTAETFFSQKAAQLELRHLVEMFIRGTGATIHHFRKDAQRVIEDRLQMEGVVSEGERGFDRIFQLRGSILDEVAPDYKAAIFGRAPDTDLDRLVVLPSSANECKDVTLPAPINMVLKQDSRKAFSIISVTEATVYIHPFSFQVYNHRTEGAWYSACPQGLSKFVMMEPLFALQGDLVIVQDWFHGGNFSHFLFDWVTRVGHFCRAFPERVAKARFLFGAIPGDFQRKVLEALRQFLSLKEGHFLFPSRGWNLRVSGRVYWFSDQVENYSHPAQTMHPLSVRFLRELGASMGAPKAGAKRIYISRNDASLRRLSNEVELVKELERRQFVVVALADMPVDRQIETVRAAHCVVAPHGMGLTHLAFHPGSPVVIELFNPLLGSDAYAFMARAMGWPYTFVIGRETDPGKRDFEVDIQDVMSALDRHGIL